MNGRVMHLIPFRYGYVPPKQTAPVVVSEVRRIPVQLTPIPWGKPDRTLARAVCDHIADFTPPTVIPYNPFTEQRMRRVLRSMRIAHD